MPIRNNDEQLRDYCKHLIESIINHNSNFKDNDFFIMLSEFYYEGTIQDIISRDSSYDDKKDFIEFLARELNQYLIQMEGRKKWAGYER